MLIPCTQKWDKSQLIPLMWPETCSSPDCVQGQPGTASLLCAAKGNAHSPSKLFASIHSFAHAFFHNFCLVCIGKMDILYQYHSDATRERATSGYSYSLEQWKNKYIHTLVLIWNIYWISGQMKSQINRHSTADFTQTVDSCGMLQYGTVLSVSIYACHHYRNQKRAGLL